VSGFDIEKTLWTGAPAKGIKFVGTDLFLVPFSFVWTGMAISFVVTGWQERTFDPFLFLPALFVIIGSYFTVGRLLHDAYLRAHTRYTLTNRRLLIERDGLQPRRLTIDVRQLPLLDVREARSGRGTIYLGRAPSIVSFARNQSLAAWVPELGSTPALRSIPEVHRVAELIERAARTPSS
jgi:hypothetical protein